MRGSDFGAAKPVVCKQLWERPDVTALCCAVFNAKWNIKIGFESQIEALLEGKQRKQEDVVETGSPKTAPVIWFCWTLEKKTVYLWNK